jgi:hypothetical protein
MRQSPLFTSVAQPEAGAFLKLSKIQTAAEAIVYGVEASAKAEETPRSTVVSPVDRSVARSRDGGSPDSIETV